MPPFLAHETFGDESARHFICRTSAHNKGEKWLIALKDGEVENGARVVFARPNEALLSGAVSSGLPNDVYSVGELGVSRDCDERALRLSFADCWNKGKWTRSLYLNERHQLRERGEQAQVHLVLSPHGWGLWRTLAQDKNGSSRTKFKSAFEWPIQNLQEFVREEAASVLAGLWKADEEHKSDVSYARRFAVMLQQEREAQAWTWRRGDKTEVIRVLRAALLTQEQLWRQWSPAHSLVWTVDLTLAVERGQTGQLYARQGPMLGQIPMPSTLQDALVKTIDWFGLNIHRDEHDKHLCLKRFFNEHRPNLGVRLEVREPSAHERLEAMLEWRDWLETTRA